MKAPRAPTGSSAKSPSPSCTCAHSESARSPFEDEAPMQAALAPGAETRADWDGLAQRGHRFEHVPLRARGGSPARGGGSPIPSDVRARMEAAFAQDFSQVRIHQGAEADAVGALAYTQGPHIHFAPGHYQPGSPSGLALLGHELTHVVQQRAGRVTLPQGEGPPINAEKSLEAEADALGARAARGESVASAPAHSGQGGPPGAGPSGAAAPIQRVVRQVRGSNPPRWRSTLVSEREFDSEEAAQEADSRAQAELDVARQMNRGRRQAPAPPPADAPRTRPEEVANTQHSLTMGQHPAHFGPLMTPGGDVTNAQVSAAVGAPVAPARGPEDIYSHSGRNTSAAIFSSLQVGGVSAEESVYSRTGDRLPVEQLETRYPPQTHNAEFRNQFIFTQGKAPEGVTLPDERDQGHAEALAVHSQGMNAAVSRVGRQVGHLVNALGGIPSLSNEPTDEQLSQLAAILGPEISGSATIAENRFSCGRHGKSGYAGGCTQELANTMPQIEQTYGQAVGDNNAVGPHMGLGLFQPVLSTAGPYKKGGNPEILRNAGWGFGVHNRYDFQNGTGLERLDERQENLRNLLQPPEMDQDSAAEDEEEERGAPSSSSSSSSSSSDDTNHRDKRSRI